MLSLLSSSVFLGTCPDDRPGESDDQGFKVGDFWVTNTQACECVNAQCKCIGDGCEKPRVAGRRRGTKGPVRVMGPDEPEIVGRDLSADIEPLSGGPVRDRVMGPDEPDIVARDLPAVEGQSKSKGRPHGESTVGPHGTTSRPNGADIEGGFWGSG